MAYADTDELKEHVVIKDAKDDSRLTGCLDDATSMINDWCRRTFDKDTNLTDRFYLAPRSYEGEFIRSVIVHDFWDSGTLVVKTDDNDDGVYETTWSASDYQLEPSGGFHCGIVGWPYSEIVTTFNKAWPIDYPFPGQPNSRQHLRAISITAKFGWLNVPDAVHRSTLILASRLFSEPKAALGILDGQIYVGSDRVSRVEDMLRPYRNVRDAIGFG